MPPRGTGSGHSIARRVAPFAPLALAVLLGRAVLPGGETPAELEAARCDEVLDFRDCHTRYPAGCSESGAFDAYLNVMKNQLIQPPEHTAAIKYLTLDDFTALDSQTPDELKSRNHADFKDALAKLGEGQTAGIIGYLYYAKPSGVESSNCRLGNDDGEGTNVDYHIGIGFDSDFAAGLRPPNKKKLNSTERKILTQTSIIVEMTPHYRSFFAGSTWSVDALKNVVGRPVRVIGQLINDNEHNIPSQNCALAKTASQKQACWRASAWELHPVMKFQVCKADNCTKNSPDWLELDQIPN